MGAEYSITTKTLTTKSKIESTKIQNIFCEVSSQFFSKDYQYAAKNIMYSFYILFNSLSLVTAK